MGAAPPPLPTPPAATPPVAPATEAPWYDGFKDADLKGYAELNRNTWKSPEDVVRDAREAQKLIGIPKGELLRVPKADAKPEDWNPVYDRLGRPAAATDYKLPTVSGGDEFAGKMAPILHSAGLNQKQVDAIATGWNSYMTEAVAAQDRAQEQREQLDLQTLHREWPGEVFDQRQEMARRAVREFVSPVAGDEAKTAEMLGQIEDAIGTAAFLKLFSGIGEKVSEAKYVDGAQRTTFGMTPAAAQAALDEKKGDREWMGKVYQNPKGPEGQEWTRLIELAARARV